MEQVFQPLFTEFINTVEAMTVTHSIEVESSELDELVSQGAITVDDDIVDDRPGT